MGNRAVITTSKGFKEQETNVGVYLHWNGGRDSVEAFLEYCKLKGFRTPDYDCYGWARLCQVIGNFFGGGLSIGIDTVARLDTDNFDNGVYIIEGWDIVGREHFEGSEQDSYDLLEMLIEIDKEMPEKEQIGEDVLRAEEVKPSSLKVGDKVYIQDYRGNYVLVEVAGFGRDGEIVNGRTVTDIPYVNYYGGAECARNINNYLFCEWVRLHKN